MEENITLDDWLEGRSETFSALCREKFKRAEVVAVHLAIVAMAIVAIVAGNIIEWIAG